MGWGPSPFGWLPEGLTEETGFRLDIVSLLAVIGEYAMAEQAQPLTASWLCLLPRLLPAPQVLLKPTRPFRMPDYKAKVVAVKGGTMVETLNYFPNILHPLDNLKPLDFQVYEIKHNLIDEAGKPIVPKKQAHPRRKSDPLAKRDDLELNEGISPLSHRATALRDVLPPRQGKDAGKPLPKPLVPVKEYSPLQVLDIASFILTLVIVFFCIWNRDAIACIALATLSLISSIVGFASKWTPSLTNRSSVVQAPRGDVVIRTREGGFILVLCTEEVARELYFGNEQCIYKVKSTVAYRALVGTATFLLMSSVVLLGNCKFIQQAAIGTAYIILNFCYWMVSLIPKKHLWDLSKYDCRDLGQTPEFLKFKEMQERMNANSTYTRTLWYAIYWSRGTDWVHRASIQPKTEIWDLWLDEADANQKANNHGWNPVIAINKLLKAAAVSIPPVPTISSPQNEAGQQVRRRAQGTQNDRDDIEALEQQLLQQLEAVQDLKIRMKNRDAHERNAATW